MSNLLGGNTNKTGVPETGLEREKIDKIILEASRNSKYYAYQLKRDQRIEEKATQLLERKKALEKDHNLIRKSEEEVDEYIAELEAGRDLSRTFMHVDMDAFYAAVETLKNPSISQLPMAVGGESMLCTANYEARKYGVSAAMPGYIARQLCPHLTIIPPDFPVYKEASAKVHSIFAVYDPNFVSFSLDEACLDVTEYLKSHADFDAPILAQKIRDGVREETGGLTCSIGIAVNRQLAKICSNINKPNGQYQIPANADSIKEFLHSLPVRKISGVGKVTAKVLSESLNIEKCIDILEKAKWIKLLFSQNQFEFLLSAALGVGSNQFSMEEDRERKSISQEVTFSTVTSLTEMEKILKSLCVSLSNDLAEQGLAGRTIGLKMKSSTFEVTTRAHTLNRPIHEEEDLYRYARELLIRARPKDLRLLGVRLSSLVREGDEDEVAVGGSISCVSLDRYIVSEKEEIVRPECPICQVQIQAHPDDTIRINEHIDNCLKQQEEESPKPTNVKRKQFRSVKDFFIKTSLNQ